MSSYFSVIFPFLAVLLPIAVVTKVTDKLGWTSFYKKKNRDTSILGSIVLGTENIFVPEQKRAAIEYRIDKKHELGEQKSGQGLPEDEETGRE